MDPLKKMLLKYNRKLTKYSQYNLLKSNKHRGEHPISTEDGKPVTIRKFPITFIVGIIGGILFAQLSIFLTVRLSLFVQQSSSPFWRNESETIADKLFNEVRVLCWIMTGPANHKSRAEYVKNTWGQRCNKLLFMSSSQDTCLGTIKLSVPEGRAHLWDKTKEAFKYVYKHHLEEYDWFLKADDDTYVIVENLRKMLYSYSTDFPIYLGNRRLEDNVKEGIMHGGAGYVLSREALKRFIEKGLPNDTICNQPNNDREDAQLGACLANIDVIAGDSRDEFQRERMFPHSMEVQLPPYPINQPDFYWHDFYYNLMPGPDTSSDYAISFHYIKPFQMYELDYLIYHLRPFGIAPAADILPKKKSLHELINAFSIFSNRIPKINT